VEIFIHQTDLTVADFDGVYDLVIELLNGNELGLHILPEMALTGYPLQDLCLKKPFISSYQELCKKINTYSEKLEEKDIAILIGGIDYKLDKNKTPIKLQNVIYELRPGSTLNMLYAKRLLPNYDIFDEKKYFTEGNGPKIWSYKDSQIALMICEDMWPTNTNPHNPTEEMATLAIKEKINIDLIINLSASPFHLGKQKNRLTRGKEISNHLKAPFIYVNRVGGEDDILFDGRSFIVSSDELLIEAPAFIGTTLKISLPDNSKQKIKHSKTTIKTENSWESLYAPRLNRTTFPTTLTSLTDEECKELLDAIKFGLLQYSKKSGFNKFLVALSGGIDSALVLAIIKLSLNENQSVKAIFMPGLFSSPISYDLASYQTKSLDIKMYTMPIKFLHSAIKNGYQEAFGDKLQGLANENIQSRLRGALLYAHANDINAIPINTSNKSEIAVGYSTLYGDSVGAISLLGDLYKSEVYSLAKYINKTFNNMIPKEVITRPPTAELRENQADEDSLPPYSRLDPILESILSYHLNFQDMIQLGFNEGEITDVLKLYKNSEYKRQQFCPIIKLKSKSFGFGYRVPISKDGKFYFNNFK
jgi:NAD+ synthase (glutamine-hydrolysing)